MNSHVSYIWDDYKKFIKTHTTENRDFYQQQIMNRWHETRQRHNETVIEFASYLQKQEFFLLKNRHDDYQMKSKLLESIFEELRYMTISHSFVDNVKTFEKMIQIFNNLKSKLDLRNIFDSNFRNKKRRRNSERDENNHNNQFQKFNRVREERNRDSKQNNNRE